MPFNAEHNVLQLFGDRASGGDLDGWSCTLRLGEGDTVVRKSNNLINTSGILDDIEADLTTWWNAISANFTGATRFLGFKFNGVGEDGRYLDQSGTLVRDFASPKVGASSGNGLPAQVALAVTFRTDAARGLASRGRIYLPFSSASALTTDGRISTTRAGDIATATATLLSNLSNWPQIDPVGDPGRVVIASSVGAGAMRRVNRVQVGDRLDVQRRRANRHDEVFSAPVLVNS